MIPTAQAHLDFRHSVLRWVRYPPEFTYAMTPLPKSPARGCYGRQVTYISSKAEQAAGHRCVSVCALWKVLVRFLHIYSVCVHTSTAMACMHAQLPCPATAALRPCLHRKGRAGAQGQLGRLAIPTRTCKHYLARLTGCSSAARLHPSNSAS